MCAIAGIFDLEYNRTILDAMLSSMKHRGPDDTGILELNQGCLLHTRLAVIDPEGGKQPMDLKRAGERYTIVYNGELYNTQEVRNLLSMLGHVFEGHSDTEVVLHAYAEWGQYCLDRLNGIFAFAVWEHQNHRLFLARDRMGVKPLFYTLFNGGIIFASEIKTILQHPEIPTELDEEGAAQLLLLGPGRKPGSGVFRNIYEIEPGYFGTFAEGRFTKTRYWSLKDREHTDTLEETAEYVRWLVTDAIRRQMVSDVPIGTFLSGGLDSSLISAVCSEYMESAGHQLSTFSLDYENNDQYFVPGKFQPNSDTGFIRIMQEKLQSDHYWTVLTPENLIQSLTAATCARDLPGMADVDSSLLAFCGSIRKKVKVALSGECADEIFGGYPWYRDPEVLALNGFPWAQNTSYRAAFLHPEILNKINPQDYVHSCYQTTIESCDILPGSSEQERRMKQMVNLNQQWFMQTLLDRKDRMSMHHGLEVRVPFCDYRIAEYMYGVPWEYKDHKQTEKGLLRYAMHGRLPDEILWRKKSPYPKTHDPGYTKMVSAELEKLIVQKHAPLFDLVSREALKNLLREEDYWPWYGQLMGIPQTIAYMLQINMWLKMYSVDIL